MSQIQTFGMAGIPPAGPVLTLTGDTGGAVSPGGGNIDIISLSTTIGFAEVIGNILPNTLYIAPLGAAITTNDAVATYFVPVAPVAFPTLPASSAYVLSANIIGSRDDFTASCGGFTTGAFRREAVGGTILVGGSYQTLANEDAPVGTPTFGVGVNGNTAAVFVQGLAGQTWNWSCTFTFQRL